MYQRDRWLIRHYPGTRAGRGPGWYLVDSAFELEPIGPFATEGEATAHLAASLTPAEDVSAVGNAPSYVPRRLT